MNLQPDPLDAAAVEISTALARLPIEHQSAMEHDLRRRILRQLHAEPAPQTRIDLAAAQREPLSSISYHVRMLLDCGLLTTTATRRVRGSIQPCLASAVSDDRGICSLLAATEASDGGP